MRLSIDEAQLIALNMLSFLLSSTDRAKRFFALSGLTPGQLRERMNDRYFLAGVVDYLLADESQLHLFLEGNGLDPKLPALAVEVLRGGAHAV